MIFKLHSDSYPKGEKLIKRKISEASDIMKIDELLIETADIKEEFFTNEYYRKIVQEAVKINVNKKNKL